MSKISQGHLLQPGIPGTISVVSRQNTVHNPSLVQDIWQFDHDPDDQFIKKIIRDKQAKLRKQHSHQQLQKIAPLYPNQGSNVNPQKYRYHSQVTMEMQKNQYGLTGNKQSNLQSGSRPHNSKKSLSRSKSNGSNTHLRRDLRRKSRSNQSKDSLQHIRNIEKIALSLAYFEEQHQKPQLQQFYDQHNDTNHNSSINNQVRCSPTRNLDIYSHKYTSNTRFLFTQIKQLLQWNKMYRIQADIQDHRKSIMKLEIECRKLRIGLRNSVSAGGLFKLRRKQYIRGIGDNEEARTPKNNNKNKREDKLQNRQSISIKNNKKRSLLKPTWGSKPSKNSRTSKIQSEKQRNLADQINSERKKYQNLGTRESLVTNYYHVLKNKLLSQIATDNTLNEDTSIPISLSHIPNNALPHQSKIITPKSIKQHQGYISESIIPSIKISQNRQQFSVLLKRKSILIASIDQSKEHYNKKITQLSEQILIMKKEFQIIENKLYGFKVSKSNGRDQIDGNTNRNHYQSKPHQLYYNNNYAQNTSKKINQFRRNQKNSNGSQKKLIFRSSSKQQLTNTPYKFGNNANNSRSKNQNWKLNKIKSNKDFFANNSNDDNKIGHSKKQKPLKQHHYFNQHSQYFIHKKPTQ